MSVSWSLAAVATSRPLTKSFWSVPFHTPTMWYQCFGCTLADSHTLPERLKRNRSLMRWQGDTVVRMETYIEDHRLSLDVSGKHPEHDRQLSEILRQMGPKCWDEERSLSVELQGIANASLRNRRRPFDDGVVPQPAQVRNLRVALFFGNERLRLECHLQNGSPTELLCAAFFRCRALPLLGRLTFLSCVLPQRDGNGQGVRIRTVGRIRYVDGETGRRLL